MSAATLPEITISADVREFLKRHDAEAAFDKVCNIVRQCYPDLCDMKFRLEDDPDLDGRSWCSIDITLPLVGSEEERLARWRNYHERVVDELPFDLAQWFGVWRCYRTEQL